MLVSTWPPIKWGDHKKTIWSSPPRKWGYDIIKERKKKIEDILVILQAWFKISINIDILILGFHVYIENIREISVDSLTEILIRWKLLKIYENIKKKTLKK